MSDIQENENLVLVDEEGNEVEFEFIGSLESEGVEYIVLSPVAEDIEEVVIFKIEKDGEDEILVEIEDDEEWEKVADLWQDASEEE